MTYWALNAVFLAVAVLVASAALLARRSPRWRALGLAALAVLALTAVFDNVMIAADLFGYNDDRISGAFLGLAPLEDFAYAIAAVVLLPSLWHLLERGPGRAHAAPAAASRAKFGSVAADPAPADAVAADADPADPVAADPASPDPAASDPAPSDAVAVDPADLKAAHAARSETAASDPAASDTERGRA